VERDHPSDGGRLLTVHEVAEYLRVSDATVWRWLREGRLRGLKIGNARRIPLDEIRELTSAGAVREAEPSYGAVSGPRRPSRNRLFVAARLRERLREMREDRAAQGGGQRSISSAEVLDALDSLRTGRS